MDAAELLDQLNRDPSAVADARERARIAELAADGRQLVDGVTTWRTEVVEATRALDARLANLDLDPALMRVLLVLIGASDLTEVMVQLAAAAQGHQRTG